MAFLQVNMMSECLMRTVNVNVILPSDKIAMPDKIGQKPMNNNGPFKTLYLLHGVFGSNVDWVNGTNIQRWAEEKNLAVVMPAGENKFYLDLAATREYYGMFIGRELVELTRRMFPLSSKKEDTFLAGLSMGGFGALRNGLKYRDTFGYVIGLSAADIFNPELPTGMYYGSRENIEAIVGNYNAAKNSDMNIQWLIDHIPEAERKQQRIYMCCGVDDSLLGTNRQLRDRFIKAGFDVTYTEGPGAHEWDFWNRNIKEIIDWLPLECANAGISSGNVK